MNREAARRRSFPFSRKLCWVLALFVAGCGKKREHGLALVESSVTAPPILRSEADQVAIPVRLDAPLRFENRGPGEKFVAIAKTGCSCYGMATVDALLQPGERVGIPPGGSRELYFVAKQFAGETEQGFRVAFQVGGESDAGTDGAPLELRADCSMKIIPDLVLEPASVIVDVSGTGLREPGAAQNLKVTRVTRGRPGESAAPVLEMGPAFLKSGAAQLVLPSKQIADGLWQSIWKVSVTPENLPDEALQNGGRFSFALAFPESADPAPTLRPGSPPGSLPTVLDVSNGRPPLRVSGQLIVRRSRGIIAPAQLHFGAIGVGDQPRTRRLVLTAADHKPFQVMVDKVPEHFEASVDSPESAEQQWVTVKFSPQIEGDVEAELRLKTTHPEQPDVVVMLKARVQ